jgi:cell division protein FtsB
MIAAAAEGPQAGAHFSLVLSIAFCYFAHVTMKAVPSVSHHRLKRWLRRGVVFFACAILLDSLVGDRGLAQTIRARRDYSRASSELARLKEQNAALRDEVRRLAADAATIEAVARQELGLARPGEILVVVRDVR